MAKMVICFLRVIFLWILFLPLGAWAGQGADPSQESEPAQKSETAQELEILQKSEPLMPALPVTQPPGWRERMSDPARWENWHERVTISVVAAAERIDRFFGDERLEDDNESSRLKLGLGLQYHKEDGASLVTDIKARLALPHLKNRFHLIIDDSFESDEPGDTSAFSEAVKDSEPDTALRYIISQNERRRLSADLGVRLSSPSQLFGRLRGRIMVPYALWELRLTQAVAWFTDDGLVTTSEMRWTRDLFNSWLLRASSRLTWEENRNGVTPAQSFKLFKELTVRRAYAFSISGSWPEMPHTHNAEYTVEFTYRQLIHSHWLFLEITPALEFPQESDYAVTPRIEFKFEIVFDEGK